MQTNTVRTAVRVACATLPLLGGCTSFLPQNEGEGDVDCQIICRLADGTLEGGGIVSFESLFLNAVEAAQLACEAQIEENPALHQEDCPQGSAPAECSCYRP